MIFLSIIIGLVIILFIIQCIQWNNEGEAYGFGIFCGWVLVTAFTIEIICIFESISESRPSAMDVYQGKTTLEYTIRDGEVIDSVVVWKENINNED